MEGFSLQELEGRGNHPGWLQTWLDTPEEMTSGRGPRDGGSGKSPLEGLWRGQLPGVQPLAADLVTEFWTGYQRTYCVFREHGGGAFRITFAMNRHFPHEIEDVEKQELAPYRPNYIF